MCECECECMHSFVSVSVCLCTCLFLPFGNTCCYFLPTPLGALSILEKELQPNHSPTAAAPSYRRSLACSLFYKVNTVCMYNIQGEPYCSK